MHTNNGHIAIVNRLETTAVEACHSIKHAAPRTSPTHAPHAESESDLLQQIVGTSLGPLSHLSDTINLTLDQVSDWIAKPESRRHIFNLIGLLDAQTQLLIAQQRVGAAAQLARLANDEDAAPETVRRACKDLLSLWLIERSRPPNRHARGGDDLAPLPLPKFMTQADIIRGVRQFEGRLGNTPGANPEMRAR